MCCSCCEMPPGEDVSSRGGRHRGNAACCPDTTRGRVHVHAVRARMHHHAGTFQVAPPDGPPYSLTRGCIQGRFRESPHGALRRIGREPVPPYHTRVSAFVDTTVRRWGLATASENRIAYQMTTEIRSNSQFACGTRATQTVETRFVTTPRALR